MEIKMIKNSLWCAIIFPIIGYIYGFITQKYDVFLFFLGMLIMLVILMMISWFLEDKK